MPPTDSPLGMLIGLGFFVVLLIVVLLICRTTPAQRQIATERERSYQRLMNRVLISGAEHGFSARNYTLCAGSGFDHVETGLYLRGRHIGRITGTGIVVYDTIDLPPVRERFPGTAVWFE